MYSLAAVAFISIWMIGLAVYWYTKISAMVRARVMVVVLGLMVTIFLVHLSVKNDGNTFSSCISESCPSSRPPVKALGLEYLHHYFPNES